MQTQIKNHGTGAKPCAMVFLLYLFGVLQNTGCYFFLKVSHSVSLQVQPEPQVQIETESAWQVQFSLCTQSLARQVTAVCAEGVLQQLDAPELMVKLAQQVFSLDAPPETLTASRQQ